MDSKDLHKCLNFMRTSAALAPFRELLRERYNTQVTTLVSVNMENIQRTQGRAQELNELIGLIENAPKVLEKMKSK